MASSTALVIIDMINTLDFPGGDQLLRHALPVARRIARLKRRLRQQDVPAIYVNDNFTHWLNDFSELVAICSQDIVRGAPLARLLAPQNDDYTVLKPHNSAFFNTPLEPLLRFLGAQRVLLSGIAGDQCVLASAIDAHMRGLDVVVVQDAIASITPQRNRNALAVLRTMPLQVLPAARVEVS